MVRVETWLRGASEAGLSRREFIKLGLGAMTAPMLLGCSDSVTGPGGDPRLTARPGSAPLFTPPGLSRLGLGDPRDGLLYVPEDYSAQTPVPLLVLLHGAGGSSGNWSGYYARADARNMVLLIPDSRADTWDMFDGQYGPDVEFLDRALTHTFERCRIATTRIALAGFSDGASYALSLGVSNGDLFTHLIAHSAGAFSPADPIVGRPPVYESHGRSDDVLPISIPRNTIVPALEDAGHEVTYEEFFGGHELPDSIAEEALDWFLG
jgi:predicted esterase